MNFQQRMRDLFGSTSKAARAAGFGKKRRTLKFGYVPRVQHLEDRRMLANFMVTSLADAGPGTLREAITASITNGAGNDLIQFSSSIDGGTINLTSFVNDLTAGTTAAGPSAFRINANTSLVIDGVTGLSQGITIARNSASAFRLFDVSAGSSLTLQSLTLSNGLAQGFSGGTARYGAGGGGSAGLGGAIFNQGSLTILNSTLSGNTAQGGAGGTTTTSGATAYGGGGGAGLGAAGGAVNTQSLGGVGGGPNGGTRGTLTAGQPAGAGGFGGGGGGGGGTGTGTSYSNYYEGARGGFGGGGGGAGRLRGRGGVGGFGGGAGASPAGANDIAGGYGGGNGGRKGNAGGGAGMGGAIFNNEGGVVTITNSTFTANAAIGGNRGVNGSQAYGATAGSGIGGGLFNRNGVVTITNSTFSANTVTNGDGASGKARGVFNISDGAGKTGTVNITNSILGQAGATTIADFASANIGGNAPVNAGSNNLMSNAGNFPAGGVLVVANPLLGPLQSNGGLTKTMAPLAGSPAIDGALPAAASKSDQRGMRRDPLPDIGAYEVRFVGSMIVNSAADEIVPDEFLTLREAINLATGLASYSAMSAAEKALATAGAGSLNTITFASSVDGQTIALTKFENDVTAGSTMAGPSAFFIYQTSLLIDGQAGLSQGITITRDTNPASYEGGQVPSFRLFDVGVGSSLTLESLTLTNGRAQGLVGGSAAAGGSGGGSAGLGGAIFNQGSLTIRNSTLSSNTAQGGDGGSFHSEGSTFNGGAGGAGLGAPGTTTTANSGSAGGGPNGGSGGAPGAAGAAGGFAGGGGGGGKGASSSGAGGTGGFGGGGGGAGHLSGEGGRAGFGGGGGGASGAGAFVGVGGYGGGYGGADSTGAGRTGGGGGAGMGGALFNEAGTVVITNSTFTGNAASGGAGGTAPDGNGTAGEGMGGALFNHNGSVTITSSTISGNEAAEGGRGIFNLGERYEKTTTSSSAIITISNSIVGQSDASEADIYIRRTGPPGTSQSTVSGSHNLIRTITTLAGSNTLTGTVNGDPMLGALANYGGLTPTMELLPGSAAIDAGDPGYFSPPDFDQRGASFPRVINGRIDIGAFEVQPLAPPSADFNGDGIVNGNDFLAWQRGFGIAKPNATKANGDADNDRDVDADDLAVWKAQFGSTGTAVVASASSQSAQVSAVAAAAISVEASAPVVAALTSAGAVTEISRTASITPAPLPLKPPTGIALTRQLVDAAMAAQNFVGSFPTHRELRQPNVAALKEQALARHATLLEPIAASGVAYAVDGIANPLNAIDLIADDAWQTADDFERLVFDEWSAEREKVSVLD